MRESPISLTIDLNADGVRHGFFKLPISTDDSAWGAVMTPISVIANGEGPTVLLTGGNHGDEYEGITALYKLAARLTVEEVQGRVIIVPTMNALAAKAGRRCSPLDGGNLNRSFPGAPGGGPTQQIADYFTRVLVPQCDFALDLHSGGRTLDILPFAAAHRLDYLEESLGVEQCRHQEAESLAGALAFGAPSAMMMFELDAEALYDTAVERQGKIFVTTELGGGGSTTPERQAIADRGVDNFLTFSGVLRTRSRADLEEELEGQRASQTASPLLIDMPDASCYVQSEHEGLLELCVALGEQVVAGQCVARVYPLGRAGQPAVEYRAEREGVLVARRFPAQVALGDTLAVIAEVVDNLARDAT
ncbi:N(2)-acetyl-L-2,4-diaminobutanoate deacetylase DoeB [Cobetia sp. QF-1]|uniref:N(2)-acetyl-L-2,4-diaminobutanoate deacetylase DoeB n=1 Tax=Cobetia sp. QF-1 TaxID=1969833 RepID=UPI000B539ECE|nr:N(2)-acetyl-L-2,4-diaminobutanoate deacetylase DoeB [Cobetia sp. QF-1]